MASQTPRQQHMAPHLPRFSFPGGQAQLALAVPKPAAPQPLLTHRSITPNSAPCTPVISNIMRAPQTAEEVPQALTQGWAQAPPSPRQTCWQGT